MPFFYVYPDIWGNMKKENIVTLLLLAFIIGSISYTTADNKDGTILANLSPESDIWINIFVHGTVKPPLKISDITSIRKDAVDNTFYDYSATFMRKDPRFFQYQPIQELGMHPVLIDGQSGNASGAFAEIYNIQYHEAYPNQKNFYYTWGWSGLLSRTKRKEESEKLLNDIIKLVNKYKTFGITPRIRVVGYSHGGNVVLGMAGYEASKELTIDEAIFIGMPVHRETDVFVNSPTFKKIYQVYSTKDIAQAADVFSTKYMSSHRKFAQRKCVCLDLSKVVHIRMSTTYTIEDPICKKVTRSFKVDPKHIELWSFGWKPSSYRKKFPLYPLSAASILPYVINKTDDLGNDLWVEINPYQEEMKVTSWKNNRSQEVWIIPFISKSEFNELSEVAFKYKPLELRRDCYRQIVKDALTYAIRKQHAIFYSCLRSRTSKVKPKEKFKMDGATQPITTALQGIESFIIN